MKYWLLKTDPDTFAWKDLEKSAGKKTVWDGVRNYQARNLMRDEMSVSDLGFFYHSQEEPPAVMGIVRITKTGLADPTQFDRKSKYYDDGSSPENPRWITVEIGLERALPQPVPLPVLRETKGLEEMVLLRRGSRLSVQPVTEKEWKIVLKLGGVTGR